MGERRYEISILIGPCSQTRAEQAVEELAMYTQRSRPGLFPGAALSLSWDDGHSAAPGAELTDGEAAAT